MTEAVIDHLEAIEIEKQHGKERVFTALTVLDGPSQAINEEQTVGQSGQWVGQCLAPEAGDGALHVFVVQASGHAVEQQVTEALLPHP